MALKIKAVAGDDEDDGGGDETMWTELRKKKKNQQPKTPKLTNQAKICPCASETKHRGLFQII